MIKLPDKGRCKLKQFNAALTVGSYVYVEFMSWKTCKDRFYRTPKQRSMIPYKKLCKVNESGKLDLLYSCNTQGNWVKPGDYIYDEGLCRTRPIYQAHVIWSKFQKDEVRNIRVLTEDEFLMEFMMELM